MKSLKPILFLLCLTSLGAMGLTAAAAAASVTLMRAPDGGIQPQALVDSRGTLHLIYFQGDPAHGDIYYVHRSVTPEGSFSRPIRVNSHAGSACAIGTIRGAQIAIGRDSRVSVAWNGSDQAPKGVGGGTPMLYARINDAGTAFEPERDLITWARGIDGGGSVAADSQGAVYVTWHAVVPGKTDAAGAVYLDRSTDGGKTFGRERRITSTEAGACGCCGMRAFADGHGVLYILYRSAGQSINRGTTLLVSRDKGHSFQTASLQNWRINACPMSSFSLTQGRDCALGAWETKGQVYFSTLTSAARQPAVISAAPGSGSRKYPVAVTNTSGQTVFAWVEGAGWQRGGALAWQVYNKDGTPTGEHGRTEGVPAWSLISAVARPNGNFVIFY